MSTFTVCHGRRYKSTIALGILESCASNEAIGDKIRPAGFAEVVVIGNGELRTAEALWPFADVTGPMPPEIISVTEIDRGRA